MPVTCRLLIIVLSFAGLTACGGATRGPTPATADVPGEVAAPAPLPEATGTRYVVDTAASELRILVYRDGTLAHLGHNHVISSRGLRGELWLAQPLAASALNVVLPLDSLVVDDPALRAEEGSDFPDTLPPSARAGTRENMLGEALLEAARFPDISLAVTGVSGTPPELVLAVRARVRGTDHELALPVTVRIGDTTVTATGETSVTHAQLGLTPYSALLGALRVADRIGLKYRVVASRSEAGAPQPQPAEAGRF